MSMLKDVKFKVTVVWGYDRLREWRLREGYEVLWEGPVVFDSVTVKLLGPGGNHRGAKHFSFEICEKTGYYPRSQYQVKYFTEAKALKVKMGCETAISNNSGLSKEIRKVCCSRWSEWELTAGWVWVVLLNIDRADFWFATPLTDYVKDAVMGLAKYCWDSYENFSMRWWDENGNKEVAFMVGLACLLGTSRKLKPVEKQCYEGCLRKMRELEQKVNDPFKTLQLHQALQLYQSPENMTEDDGFKFNVVVADRTELWRFLYAVNSPADFSDDKNSGAEYPLAVAVNLCWEDMTFPLFVERVCAQHCDSHRDIPKRNCTYIWHECECYTYPWSAKAYQPELSRARREKLALTLCGFKKLDLDRMATIKRTAVEVWRLLKSIERWEYRFDSPLTNDAQNTMDSWWNEAVPDVTPELVLDDLSETQFENLMRGFGCLLLLLANGSFKSKLSARSMPSRRELVHVIKPQLERRIIKKRTNLGILVSEKLAAEEKRRSELKIRKEQQTKLEAEKRRKLAQKEEQEKKAAEEKRRIAEEQKKKVEEKAKKEKEEARQAAAEKRRREKLAAEEKQREEQRIKKEKAELKRKRKEEERKLVEEMERRRKAAREYFRKKKKQQKEAAEQYWQEYVKKKAEEEKHTKEELSRQKVKPKQPFHISSSDLIRGKRLGKGGFGTVYFATWKGGPVAVKEINHPAGIELKKDDNEEACLHDSILKSDFSRVDDLERKRQKTFSLSSKSTKGKIDKKSIEGKAQLEYKSALETEAQIMHNLEHENIVKLFGICLWPEKFWLVMEYMPKLSLSDVLKNTPQLSCKICYSIAMDIASGLSYLHRRQIIHCDLKPKNILLNDQMRAKIADFGLSKTRKIYEESIQDTQSSRFCGTAQYSSPWVISEQEQQAAPSDMYSYGIILWEILTGDTPFRLLPKDLKEEPFTFKRFIILCVKSPEQLRLPILSKYKILYPHFTSIMEQCWIEDSQQRPSAEVALEELKKEKVVSSGKLFGSRQRSKVKRYVPPPSYASFCGGSSSFFQPHLKKSHPSLTMGQQSSSSCDQQPKPLKSDSYDSFTNSTSKR